MKNSRQKYRQIQYTAFLVEIGLPVWCVETNRFTVNWLLQCYEKKKLWRIGESVLTIAIEINNKFEEVAQLTNSLTTICFVMSKCFIHIKFKTKNNREEIITFVYS